MQPPLACFYSAPPAWNRAAVDRHNSVVAELNLSGFDDELAILSGRTATVDLLDRIRTKHGEDPANWMPVFQAERRSHA